MLSWLSSVMMRKSMGPHPVVENHPRMLFCLLSLRACHWQLHCSRSRRDVLLRWHTASDLDACAGERALHDWSIMLPVSQRVQPGVYTLMAFSRYRDAQLVQRVGSERPLVYQPLVPHILTACYQVVLLPPRDFGEWPAGGARHLLCCGTVPAGSCGAF